MLALTTGRLRLRPFTEDDVPALVAIHQHPALARFIPSAVCRDEEDARGLLSRFAAYDDGPLGIPAIELVGGSDDGAVAGLVMLKPIPPSGSPGAGVRGSTPVLPGPGERWDIEIGWRVHPAYEGRGLVSEAARATLAHAFAAGIDRVVAVTDPRNLASQRVALRSGMVSAGLTTAYYDAECALFEARRRTEGDGDVA